MDSPIDTGGTAADVVARLHSLSREVGDLVPDTLSGAAGPDEFVAVVGHAQDLINVLAGLQGVALAHLAATEHVECEDGTIEVRRHGLGHVREDAGDLVAGDLGCTANAAEQRVRDAVALATKAPPIVHAQLDGRLDPWKARIAVTELSGADAAVARTVSERVLGALGEGARTTGAGAFRSRLRRTLSVLDADALARRARLARTSRCLRRFAGEPGVTGWEAVLPSEEADLAWAAIDEIALGYRQQGLVDTIDAARADALMDLILGRTAATVQVTVAVPAGSMTVDPEHGYVPVAGSALASVLPAAWLSGPSSPRRPQVGEVARRVRVVECDPTSGIQLTAPTSIGAPRVEQPVGSDAYAVPSSLGRFVDSRDGGCRFPECATGSRHCDKDHLVAWPLGPTAADNLSDACRHHHRVKQRPGWSVARAPDGSLVWTDPLGRRRSSQGTDHLGVSLGLPEPPSDEPPPGVRGPEPSPAAPIDHPVRAMTRASTQIEPDESYLAWLRSTAGGPDGSPLEEVLVDAQRRRVRRANRATADPREQRRRRAARAVGPFTAGVVLDRQDRMLGADRRSDCDVRVPVAHWPAVVVDLRVDPPF